MLRRTIINIVVRIVYVQRVTVRGRCLRSTAHDAFVNKISGRTAHSTSSCPLAFTYRSCAFLIKYLDHVITTSWRMFAHIASRIVKQSCASRRCIVAGRRADVASQSRQPHLPPRSHTPAPQKTRQTETTRPALRSAPSRFPARAVPARAASTTLHNHEITIFWKK